MALKTKLRDDELEFVSRFANVNDESSDYYVFHLDEVVHSVMDFFTTGTDTIVENENGCIIIIRTVADDDAFKILNEDLKEGTNIPEPVAIEPTVVEDNTNGGTVQEELETAPVVGGAT